MLGAIEPPAWADDLLAGAWPDGAELLPPTPAYPPHRWAMVMPDVFSIGLGGGSIVRDSGDDVRVGPDSVGYKVVTEALVQGGSTVTLSDVSVRAGRLTGFGDAERVETLDERVVAQALAWVDAQIKIMVERMKPSREPFPLIAVGGGSHLVPAQIEGISEVIRPQNHAVANAYGAAIAEASGTVDRVFRYEEQGREECLEVARRLAMDAAVRSGADPDQVRITAMAEIPLTYVPGRACRVQVKAAGPLAR